MHQMRLLKNSLFDFLCVLYEAEYFLEEPPVFCMPIGQGTVCW